jgi:tRNA/tmRNA/rRNA uracil-C5-methylase (TrmA/RlmC/RlmD family)
MPTPPKPFTVLSSEKKSHRTKAELKKRQQGEEALSTGVALKERPEVKSNPTAHKEFNRLNDLLKAIGKNDAIYEGIINRYCIINAECQQFEDMKWKITNDLDDLAEKLAEREIEYITYLDYKDKLQNKLISCDKQIQSKRKMLFDIEKENIMTIAAALRSIPKKTDGKKSASLEALGGD